MINKAGNITSKVKFIKKKKITHPFKCQREKKNFAETPGKTLTTY